MTKLCCFNQDSSPFLSFPSVLSSPEICCWLWKSRYVDDEMTMQIWRWTGLLQLLIPLSHLRTDAADRGGCSIRRDPRGIRTVCVLYPYWTWGFPPRSAAIRSPILKVISCFTYVADKSVRTGSVLSPYCLRRNPYSVYGVRTLTVLHPSLSVLPPFFFSPLFVFFFVLHVLLCGA